MYFACLSLSYTLLLSPTLCLSNHLLLAIEKVERASQKKNKIEEQEKAGEKRVVDDDDDDEESEERDPFVTQVREMMMMAIGRYTATRPKRVV